MIFRQLLQIFTIYGGEQYCSFYSMAWRSVSSSCFSSSSALSTRLDTLTVINDIDLITERMINYLVHEIKTCLMILPLVLGPGTKLHYYSLLKTNLVQFCSDLPTSYRKLNICKYFLHYCPFYS